MFENLKSKFIPILLILIIIAVAGWYVGVETLSFKQSDESTAQNTDALVYALKENGKINFYKTA